MDVVSRACAQTRDSPGLKLVLELTLAIGNYMNRGARGNVHGFRLSSLLKLGDTKSSKTKGGAFTVLHYMVKMIDEQVCRLSVWAIDPRNLPGCCWQQS